MSLSRLEQETIILFNEQESAVSIYTYNERIKAQISEYAHRNPEKMSKNFIDETGALHCELPKSDLRVLLKKPPSEKQRQAALNNVAVMLEKRGIKPNGGK